MSGFFNSPVQASGNWTTLTLFSLELMSFNTHFISLYFVCVDPGRGRDDPNVFCFVIPNIRVKSSSILTPTYIDIHNREGAYLSFVSLPKIGTFVRKAFTNRSYTVSFSKDVFQGRVGRKITGGVLLSRPKCVVQVYYDCIRQTGCVL